MNERACTCGCKAFIPRVRMVPYQEITNPLSVARPDGMECRDCGKIFKPNDDGAFPDLVAGKPPTPAIEDPRPRRGKRTNADRRVNAS